MWARAADHARKKVWFSICVERRGKGQISALQKMSPPWAFNTAPEAQFAVGLSIPLSRLRRATVPQCGIVNPHLRTVPPLAARCSVAAHCALLRVLATPALRASGFAPILNSAWSSHAFAPPCANACAVFRPCGLRFAPCPRDSSRFAASDARKLACGTPCFIGVFVPACASLARYSGAAERFALSSPLHPFGASTTTACFAHSARASCAPNFFSPS